MTSTKFNERRLYNMRSLPPYISLEEISVRLNRIFPVGVPNRNFYKSTLAGRVVFTMIYIGAVDNNNIYAATSHICKMNDEQALLSDNESRHLYTARDTRSGYMPGQWYVQTAGHLIKNNIFKRGFIPLGAAHIMPHLPANSKKPKYFLDLVFANLFDPGMTGKDLDQAIEKWQINRVSHLTIKKTRDMRMAMEQLSPRQRMVYEMSQMEGYSHKEIAKKLEIPLNTVRSLLWQARNNIEVERFRNTAMV